MRKEVWDEEKKGYRTTDEDETVNQANALWARPKQDITPEQYEEFYKHVAHDGAPPLAYVHARIEGRTEYTLLLYVPSVAAVRPVGPRAPPRRQALRPPRVHHGRRRAAPAAVPALRARHRRLQRPAAQRVARDPAGIARRRSDPQRLREARARSPREPRAERQAEKYATFWKAFGTVLKEGVVDDMGNRDKLAKLCASRRRRAAATCRT